MPLGMLRGLNFSFFRNFSKNSLILPGIHPYKTGSNRIFVEIAARPNLGCQGSGRVAI